MLQQLLLPLCLLLLHVVEKAGDRHLVGQSLRQLLYIAHPTVRHWSD